MRHKNLLFVPLAALAFAGCGKQDSRDSDSVATASGSADTTGAMAGMSTTPAREANQEFLRMMIDHHQGMLQMADSALKKGGADVRSEATKMLADQRVEQQKMLAMLKAQYGEDKMPMVTPDNASMITMLSGASRAAFDRQFREHVIMHHQEAIKMVDQFSSRLTNPELKQMADKMKADQTREIAELRKKLGSN